MEEDEEEEQVGRFSKWLNEWKSAFKYARNPLKYSKKDWAVNIISSACSYGNTLVLGTIAWLNIKFPLVWIAVKAVVVKLGHGIVALVAVIFAKG